MNYENKVLPKYMVLRLKGLSTGNFMSNKHIQAQASYTFKEILLTFKLCKSKISKYEMSNNGTFTNEQHKFNGIMVIIEANINETIEILNRRKNADDKIESIDFKHQVTEVAEYKKKGSVDKTKLKELW